MLILLYQLFLQLERHVREVGESEYKIHTYRNK